MKRYIKTSTDVYEVTYIVPEAAASEFRRYLDNMSGFDDVQYDVTVMPDNYYQFDCNITFNTEFGISNKIAQLGYKEVRVNDNTYRLK